VKISNHRRRRQ